MVRDGQKVQVLAPTYNPADPEAGLRQEATVNGLYLMMGRGLERLEVGPTP